MTLPKLQPRKKTVFEARAIGNVAKPELYREIAQQLEALLEGERDPVANAANTAALLFQTLPDVNWTGFYFLRDGDQLVLGPFQGKPACVRIPVGQGVCGTAAARRESIIVADVEVFPGHIACDTASRSELVVPLTAGERLIGVLDLDSPLPSRFDAEDRAGVESLAAIYVAASNADQFFNAIHAT
ncbi:MAG TPA: GAF domain-containing protein [Rhizomicrobium sp.]|jgi:L-methionine (R)-S-oxide reductase|nr:GAF domain-containing protein [Rhizomicrobium sp.]